MHKTGKQLSASLEDYLEAIYHLSADRNVARSKDIAELLGVSRASVTGALKNLAQKELIHYKPYGYATLTDKGRQLAKRVVRRHRVLQRFFIHVLGLEEELSKEAACKAEHALGPEIIERLLLFVRYLAEKNNEKEAWAEEFSRFCELHQKIDQDHPPSVLSDF